MVNIHYCFTSLSIGFTFVSDTYVRRLAMQNDAFALSSCMCVDNKLTKSIALHLRPVAASGLFVPPKKVRTHVIYSRDECLRRLQAIHLFSERGRGVGVVNMKAFQVVLRLNAFRSAKFVKRNGLFLI